MTQNEQLELADGNLHNTHYYHDMISGKCNVDGTPKEEVSGVVIAVAACAWIAAIGGAVWYFI